jgi:hypothetical protein
MIEGYLTPDSFVYCSEECLGMTLEEIEEKYDDDSWDCVFRTNWE